MVALGRGRCEGYLISVCALRLCPIPPPLRSTMPALFYTSSFRLQPKHKGYTLKTDIRHTLQFGDITTPAYELKRPLPGTVDVHSHSDLSFCISVFQNGSELPKSNIVGSPLAQHIGFILKRVISVLLSVDVTISERTEAFTDVMHQQRVQCFPRPCRRPSEK